MWARFHWDRLEEQARPPQGNLSCPMAPRRACRRAPALCQAQRRAWLDWLREHAGPRASLVVFLTVALGLCCSEALAAPHQDIHLASRAPRVRVNCAAPWARGGKRSHPPTQALPQRRCVGASRRPLPTPRPPGSRPAPVWGGAKRARRARRGGPAPGRRRPRPRPRIFPSWPARRHRGLEGMVVARGPAPTGRDPGEVGRSPAETNRPPPEPTGRGQPDGTPP
jgi:hypothetical protein